MTGTMFTNTGCPVDVESPHGLTIDEDVIVRTPAGAVLACRVVEVSPEKVVVDPHGSGTPAERYELGTLRLYFHSADAPDVTPKPVQRDVSTSEGLTDYLFDSFKEDVIGDTPIADVIRRGPNVLLLDVDLVDDGNVVCMRITVEEVQ